MAKNPEVRENQEAPETREELDNLKKEVKDYKEFETLSKDPILNSWLNKLFNKNCEEVFSKEWKHFEKLHIWWTIQKILKKYPDLLFYITWNLWLSLEEKNFSKLSLEQKIKFTSLYQAVTEKGLFYKKNPTSQDILERVNRNVIWNMNRINNNFKRENIKNILDLEKTLKKYWLNKNEIWKVKEYLLFIKKHPEFLNWKNMTLKAESLVWYLVVAGLSLVLWLVLWAVWMHYIDNLWKIEPETTINLTVPEVVTVENPESVLKFMVTKGRFWDDPKNPIRWTEEIKMFTINDNDAWWTKWAKEKLNVIQSREIVMDLSWDVLGGFDLDEGCQIDIEENYPSVWKWIAYVQLPEPDVMILNDEANVVSENLEWIHLSEFKNTQEKLRKTLREQAKHWTQKDKDFYNKIKDDAKNNLTELFKSMKPYWMEIEEVKIHFFDPKKWEHPVKIDPHQPPAYNQLTTTPKN